MWSAGSQWKHCVCELVSRWSLCVRKDKGKHLHSAFACFPLAPQWKLFFWWSPLRPSNPACGLHSAEIFTVWNRSQWQEVKFHRKRNFQLLNEVTSTHSNSGGEFWEASCCPELKVSHIRGGARWADGGWEESVTVGWEQRGISHGRSWRSWVDGRAVQLSNGWAQPARGWTCLSVASISSLMMINVLVCWSNTFSQSVLNGGDPSRRMQTAGSLSDSTSGGFKGVSFGPCI